MTKDEILAELEGLTAAEAASKIGRSKLVYLTFQDAHLRKVHLLQLETRCQKVYRPHKQT